MYLAVLVPDDVMAAEVDGNQSRGETVIPYDTVSGTEADVENGMIAWLGTSAGAKDIGIQRVKSINAGANELTIEENDLTLFDDYHITVKKVFLPRSKLPAVDTSGINPIFTKDGESYTDEGSNVPPVVVIGPPDCQFIDAGAGYATVRFVDEFSWSPVSAALSSPIWNFDGGSDTGGVGTEADPYVITYSTAGTYWPKLTITDANGAVQVCHVPVMVFDDADPPYTDLETQPRQSSMRGTRQGYTVVGSAAQADFPDGTWVVRFNRDYYGGAESVLETRYPFRGHIKFAGFLIGDSVRTDTNVSRTSFEAEDITGVLARLPGWGDRVEDVATATRWTEIEDLDVLKAVLHVLRWSTTVLEITGVRYTLARSASEILIQSERWGEGSILQQCQQTLSSRGIFADLVGDVQGTLHIRQDPNAMDHSDRSSTVVTVVDLADTDFKLLNLRRLEYVQAQYVRLSGLAWNGSAASPYQSYAPGVPDQATPVEDVSGQVLVSQADTSRLAGDIFAKRNNTFGPSTIELPGNWDVFDPALQERITFVLAADENNRGLVFTDSDYWIVREVSVNEDAAGGFVRSVTLTLEREVEGTPGTGGTVASQPTWSTPATPASEPSPRVGTYPGQIIGTDSSGVWYADVLDGGSTDWEAMNTGLSGSALNITDLLFLTVGATQVLFAATGDGIYKYAALPSRSGTWTQVIDVSPNVPLHLHFSTTDPGWCYFIAYRDFGASSTVVLYYSSDYFDNTAGIQVSGSNVAGSPLLRGYCWSAPNDPETVYVAASIAAGANYYSRLWVVDLSAGPITVTQLDQLNGAAADAGLCACFVPHGDPDIIYWARDASGSEAMRRSVDGGATFGDITAADSPQRLYGPYADKSRVIVQTTGGLFEWTPGGGLVQFGSAYTLHQASRVIVFSGVAIDEALMAGKLWGGAFTNLIVHDDDSTVTDLTGDGDFADRISAIAQPVFEGL